MQPAVCKYLVHTMASLTQNQMATNKSKVFRAGVFSCLGLIGTLTAGTQGFYNIAIAAAIVVSGKHPACRLWHICSANACRLWGPRRRSLGAIHSCSKLQQIITGLVPQSPEGRLDRQFPFLDKGIILSGSVSQANHAGIGALKTSRKYLLSSWRHRSGGVSLDGSGCPWPGQK